MRVTIGFLAPLLALATACSDDGLANQSSGQAETSTTGAPVNDDVGSGANTPASGTGREDDSSGTPPPGGTTEAGDGTGGTGTAGPESLTETGTSTAADTGSTGTGTGTETEGTTGGPSQACADGCAVEFACGTEWASAEDCVAWCEANLDEANLFSPFCRDAWEALSACLATLTCEEFAQWESPMACPYPCSDADVILSIECKGQ